MIATITILKTSEKGAHLITDGENTTWIKPSWMRADGSLTPAAERALENGEPYLSKDEYFAKKEAEREAVKWTRRPASMFTTSKSGKAYGVRVSVYECISEQSIGRWLWFPASQCRIEDDTMVLPTWLVDAKIRECKEDAATGSFSAATMEIDF